MLANQLRQILGWYGSIERALTVVPFPSKTLFQAPVMMHYEIFGDELKLFDFITLFSVVGLLCGP